MKDEAFFTTVKPEHEEKDAPPPYNALNGYCECVPNTFSHQRDAYFLNNSLLFDNRMISNNKQ